MPKLSQSVEPEPVQIAELLGLPRPSTFDGLKLADSVAHGFPVRSVERMVGFLDPSKVTVSAHHFVPKSTLTRRKAAEALLSPDKSGKLWQVARVFVEARRQYRSDEAARDFLLRAHPLLGGRRPFDLASETAAGAELVLKVLGEAEAGVAV